MGNRMSSAAAEGAPLTKRTSRGRIRMAGQDGQSLIIVVLAMFVVIGISALAIDVAQWYQKHHQAQVSADSAALAAANCLANSKCTPGTATGTATSMAATNRVPASIVSVNTTGTNGGNVTVTTSTIAPQQFSAGQTPRVSAQAVASYTNHLTAPASIFGSDCATPTLPPTSPCTIDCTKPGVTVLTSGGTNIPGAIVTNGSLDLDLKGGTTIGDIEYGGPSGASCAANNVEKIDNNTTVQNGPAEEQSFASLPETFNNVWTSTTTNECSNSSLYAPNGSGTGNFAGISIPGWTSDSTYPNEVDIGTGNQSAIGSSGSPVIICANTIVLGGNGEALTNMTLVANTFTFTGSTNGFTITPASTATSDQSIAPNVAFYATSSSGINFGSNNVNITGVVYAPLGKITLVKNNTGPGFLEGNQVEDDGNNTAGGPQIVLTAFPGVDSLIQ